MNGPLHFYLIDLVGNVQELVITADNAKIPIDQLDHSGSCWGGDESMHSSFTSYSMHSSSSLASSSSSLSSSSSSSRWDSDANPNPSKEMIPKLPPRRLNSISPPASPVRETQVLTHLRCVASSDEAKSSSPSPEPFCLSSAARGMLRMPQRRASMDKDIKTNIRRRMQRSRRQNNNNKGDDIDDDNDLRPLRNVSEILGEAIRELGFSEGELESAASSEDPSLAMHAQELLAQRRGALQ